MTKYREKVIKAREEGKPDPIIPNYIGACFMKINERLSLNRNFINYTYREDMIADGIENCIVAVHNFDPEKSKNPFGYFTQISWYAFVRRILKENTQNYIKYKSYQNMNVMGDLFEGEDTPGVSIGSSNEFMDEAIRSFEESKRKKDLKAKAKKEKKGLETFIDTDEMDEMTMKKLDYVKSGAEVIDLETALEEITDDEN